MKKLTLWTITLAFALLTILAVKEHGATGIFAYQLANLAGKQVLADLVIALGLFLAWMWPHAKAHGRNPYLWAIVTLVVGSFGPLLYLLTQKDKAIST